MDSEELTNKIKNTLYQCFPQFCKFRYDLMINFYLKTRMHSSRMRTARLRIVPGGVVSWSRGEGGKCCDLVPGGRDVLSAGPRGREGVVSWSRGGGEGGVVSWSRGEGRCCQLVPGGREGGVVTGSMVAHPPPTPELDRQMPVKT